MLNKKIGFLGCGNMAKAMINGLITSKLVKPDNILVYDRKPDTNKKLAKELNVTPMSDIQDLAVKAEILIVAVKPNIISSALGEALDKLKADTLIVSVAAGVTLDQLTGVLGKERKIIRVMPNTPALVGEGMSSITPNQRVTEQEIDTVLAIFNSFGKAEVVKEDLIHAVVGVSGSAPAYIFMVIEAMADAAVLGGLSRVKAYQFAAQAVKGAAQMVLESSEHPGVLKDRVCSPGGTTIEAVKVLEEQGLRSAIMNAMQACMDKSRHLSGE